MSAKCMSFPFRLNNLGGATTVDVGTVAHIEENLTQILTTRKGERAMLPTYGCNVDFRIFDNIDSALQRILLKEVQESILAHEPRINVESDDISIISEGTTLYIQILYSIKVDSSSHNYTLQL